MRAISTTSGFTIVEILVVIVILGILAGLLYGPFDDLYKSNTRGLQTVIQSADTRGTLRTIEKNIALSVGFLASNTGTTGAADPEAGGTTWSYNVAAGTAKAALITTNYASEVSAGVRTIAYVLEPGCNNSPSVIPKYLYNNYVYYIKNNALYRRTLLQNTVTCSGAPLEQKRTCTNPSATPTCTATDAKIIDNVIDLTVNYYVSSDSSTDTVPANAKTVLLTLMTKVGVGTSATTSVSSLRISRING